MAKYTEDPAKVGTYNPEQWKFDEYTGQYVENAAYKDKAQYGDPAMGTDVVYPDGGGTEHFAPGETPTSFLSAGDNYAGGVKAAVPGSQTYEDLKDDAATRNWQGIAKVGALIGGAAAAAGTNWSTGGAAPGMEAATTYPLAEAGPITATPIAAGGGAAAAAPAAAAGTGLMAPAASAAAPAAVNQVAQTPSKFKPVLDFLKDNKDIIGQALGGLGEGISAGAQNDAEIEHDLALLRERHALTSSNYLGADPAKAFRGLAPGTSTQSPSEKYGKEIFGGWQWKFDPKQGGMVRVPIDPPRAQAG